MVDPYLILTGDCRARLADIDPDSVDSVVSDPPYGLEFMGQEWDSFGAVVDDPATVGGFQDGAGGNAYSRSRIRVGHQKPLAYQEFMFDVASGLLRVMKPGAYGLMFGGTRTYHRVTCALEDAGFEIRDCLGWLYGCLDEETSFVSPDGEKHYKDAKVGDPVLCYNPETCSYSWQPIQEVLVYDYRDTAYRLIGDFGEQVVSRNHRVLIERNGSEVFQAAETLPPEVRIPFLEDLSGLLYALPYEKPVSGGPQQNLQPGVQQSDAENSPESSEAVDPVNGSVRRLRTEVCSVSLPLEASEDSGVQSALQRETASEEARKARPQGSSRLVCGGGTRSFGKDARGEQPLLEGRGYLPQSERPIREPEDPLRPMPRGISFDGPARRLRHGAQVVSSRGDQPLPYEGRSRSPHESRRNGQQSQELDAVLDEQPAQEVRGWAGHKTGLVRVVPFFLHGKVWCLRVPTGCFVAARRGVTFPTGNSGFPKSSNQKGDWSGWGTALKPAWEPIILFRKPSKLTVPRNLATHGVGALNIDGCRVGDSGGTQNTVFPKVKSTNAYGHGLNGDKKSVAIDKGRWPANILHDGSDEVLSVFPEQKSNPPRKTKRSADSGARNTFGSFAGQNEFLIGYGDSGSAARFFYCAKASKADRDEGLEGFEAVELRGGGGRVEKGYGEGEEGLEQAAGKFGARKASKRNTHPTVKPTDLMRYLCRLVTPPGGLVLDPFSGSGSTGKAALLEGFWFIGMDQNPDFARISEARCAWAAKQREAAGGAA